MNTDNTQKARTRVLLAKPGHDTHDRGVRLVGRRFRDAGFEVIFINFLVADEVVNTAVQEDVDVVGVSSSSGGHMQVFKDLIAGLKENEMDNVFLLGGGIIPEDDADVLRNWGVNAIFGPGTKADDAVNMIKTRFSR